MSSSKHGKRKPYTEVKPKETKRVSDVHACECVCFHVFCTYVHAHVLLLGGRCSGVYGVRTRDGCEALRGVWLSLL